jgi:hypothetical protein
MLTAYYRFEVLPERIKKQHKITGITRLDCTAFANPKKYAGMSAFEDKKGHMRLYKRLVNPANPFSTRFAKWALYNGSLNLSSIYYENQAYSTLGYGYPNGKKYRGKDNSPNPLYAFRNDCYLFLTDQDLSKVEVLVIANGRNSVNDCYKLLLRGALDNELQNLRLQAKPFFNYGSSL